MAVDKLVDSTQLNSDLTSVANAIRTKGGTSAQLAFPADFISAIDAISGGGGYTNDEYLSPSVPNGAVTSDETLGVNNAYFLSGKTAITSLHLTEATSLPQYYCRGCTALTVFVGEKTGDIGSAAFNGDTSLTALDFTSSGQLGTDFIRYATNCKTIIIRGDTLKALASSNPFRNSAFASGGAGGDIYINKSLYDHLGDNSALDYKHASNWSTYDGYGTITWKKIEGSIYETQYADGTAIS